MVKVYTDFEYIVYPLRNSTLPHTIELTCTEVHRKTIRHRHVDDKPMISSTPFPDKTSVYYSGLLSLNEPYDVAVDVEIERGVNAISTIISRPTTTTPSNDYSLSYVRFSQIMEYFCLPTYVISIILRDVEKVITSRDRGVIEVKIWKIIKTVYKIESVFIERYGIDSNRSKEMNNGCVICMEDYTKGVFVANRLPCDHDFHAACVLEWLKINPRCPLCRVPISLQGKLNQPWMQIFT